MKKYIFTLCLFIGSHALAGETIKSIDIINTSDIPVTVTYEECYMDSSRNVKTCSEKTAVLGNKNSGANYVYIDASSQEKQQSVLVKQIAIRKIVSSLGEQDFLSFEDYNRVYKELAENKVLGVMPNLCVGRVDINTGINLIVLDNLGANKFYCGHSYQAN